MVNNIYYVNLNFSVQIACAIPSDFKRNLKTEIKLKILQIILIIKYDDQY